MGETIDRESGRGGGGRRRDKGRGWGGEVRDKGKGSERNSAARSREKREGKGIDKEKWRLEREI